MTDSGPKSLDGEVNSVEFPRAGTGSHQQLTPCGSQPHPCSIFSSRSDISALRPDKFSGLPPSKVSEVVSPLLSNPHPRRQQHSVTGHPAPLCPTLHTPSLWGPKVFMARWQHATVLRHHRLHVRALLSRCLNSSIQQAQGEFSGGNEVVTSYQLSDYTKKHRLSYRDMTSSPSQVDLEAWKRSGKAQFLPCGEEVPPREIQRDQRLRELGT